MQSIIYLRNTSLFYRLVEESQKKQNELRAQLAGAKVRTELCWVVVVTYLHRFDNLYCLFHATRAGAMQGRGESVQVARVAADADDERKQRTDEDLRRADRTAATTNDKKLISCWFYLQHSSLSLVNNKNPSVRPIALQRLHPSPRVHLTFIILCGLLAALFSFPASQPACSVWL